MSFINICLILIFLSGIFLLSSKFIIGSIEKTKLQEIIKVVQIETEQSYLPISQNDIKEKIIILAKKQNIIINNEDITFEENTKNTNINNFKISVAYFKQIKLTQHIYLMIDFSVIQN